MNIEHGERTTIEHGIWIATDHDRTFIDNDTLYELCEADVFEAFILEYFQEKALLAAGFVQETSTGCCYGTNKLREFMAWNG